MFALPVVAQARSPAWRPRSAAATWPLASAPRTGCRSPTCRTGLRLDSLRGAGEVQTPLRGSAAERLRVGDRVYFRHVKAGELCERFNRLYLDHRDDHPRRGPHLPRRGQGPSSVAMRSTTDITVLPEGPRVTHTFNLPPGRAGRNLAVVREGKRSRLRQIRVAPAGNPVADGLAGSAPTSTRGGSSKGRTSTARTTPFVLRGVLPFVLLPFAATSVTDPQVLVAAALVPRSCRCCPRAPWARIPAWTQAVPLLAYFVVDRDSCGTRARASSSIFDPLVAMPVVWFAHLRNRRRAGGVGRRHRRDAGPARVVIGEPLTDTGQQFVLAAVAVGLASALGRAVHLVILACDDRWRVAGPILQRSRRPSSRSTRTA